MLEFDPGWQVPAMLFSILGTIPLSKWRENLFVLSGHLYYIAWICLELLGSSDLPASGS